MPDQTRDMRRRDPRTGEAATDPTRSRADDPTHGVDRPALDEAGRAAARPENRVDPRPRGTRAPLFWALGTVVVIGLILFAL